MQRRVRIRYRRAVMHAALAAALGCACSHREPLASCDDDLRGVYTAVGERRDDNGIGIEERWMVLDNGTAIEAYPLFPDGAPGPQAARLATATAIARTGNAPELAGLEVAPRVLDLVRGPDAGPRGLAGTLHRRYIRRAAVCDARIAVQLTRCSGDLLELVLSDPSPPTGFSPCMWPAPGPSRVVRWRRH